MVNWKPLKIRTINCLFYFVLLAFFGCNNRSETKILVFTKTAGFEHESIPAGAAALLKLGQENNFRVDTTSNSAKFTEETLQQYHAVVFLNTTGDVLDYRQQADFERFIQAGGGFVGVHAAADTEYDWPWYGNLVGGYFESHPEVQKATINLTENNHISTEHLPKQWERIDEWYNYKSLNPEIKVLASLNEGTYDGGKNGEHHPIIWYHDYDGGKAFYTGGGHTNESYQEPDFLKHLLNGILWAAGEDELNYELATTEKVPNDSRFTKTVLSTGLDEPTELAILDDGKVLLVERKGEVKLYDPSSLETKLVGKLNVHTEEEDGLMGVAIDPDFEQNNWVYMYYSPAGAKEINVLSRFLLKDDELEMTSEMKILEVPVQRKECCHTGGSIAFDAHGNLYLSTGDNTNPFASDGYAPIDESHGRSAWDASGTSGNTNDLRGKILRIRPEVNGSYTSPKGNLFPPNGAIKGSPEIYVMGNRNPYRISIDPKTNFLYWGEVGPDAGNDSIRGPKGYDEINQARKAGNFGWPFFIADNKPYRQYDFAKEKLGELFDPARPVNNSPNNTGSKILPPAQDAFIWYPYSPSKEFPLVGEGGRTSMAGPVFYSDFYTESGINFPAYYNGKLFIYEWMRNWIMAVTIDEEGDFVKMEPFLPEMDFSRPMDMDFGSDGALYLLEYGQDWFSKNEGAQLVRVEYSEDNNSPNALATVEQQSGEVPFKARFSAKGSFDRDEKDVLTYAWYFTGDEVQSTEVEPSFTFDKPGTYKVVLEIMDSKGASAKTQIEVRVGNANPAEVKASEGELGHKAPSSKEDIFQAGLKSIEKSDCRACHAIDNTVVGPSYLEIAARYKDDPNARNILVDNIIQGSRGNWGDRPMAAHPQLSKEEVGKMVDYILSLADNKESGKSGS